MKRFLVIWLCIVSLPIPVFATSLELPTTGLAGPRQPQVAVSADGMLHVVFGDGTTIYATRARSAEMKFEAPVKIGELPKLALGMRRGPRIVAAEGRLVATAISLSDGDLHSWLSDDAGKTWRSAERINTVANSAREGLHAMAGDGHGLVICVWLDLRGSGMELWSRVSFDGGVKWEPEVRVYASPDGAVCTCCVPSVAIGPRGEIAAMWRNALGGARDMWTASSVDGGRTFGPAHRLGTGTWKLQACPMDGGGLAFSADGRLHTAWRREATVYASGSDGAESALAEDAVQPIVVSNGAKVVMLWNQADAVWVRSGGGEARKLAQPAQMTAAAPLGAGFIAVWEEPRAQRPLLRAETFE